MEIRIIKLADEAMYWNDRNLGAWKCENQEKMVDH